MTQPVVASSPTPHAHQKPWTYPILKDHTLQVMTTALSTTRVHPDRMIYAFLSKVFIVNAPRPIGGKRKPGFLSFEGDNAGDALVWVLGKALLPPEEQAQRRRPGPGAVLEFLVQMANETLDMLEKGTKDEMDDAVLKGMRRCGHLAVEGRIVLPQHLRDDGTDHSGAGMATTSSTSSSARSLSTSSMSIVSSSSIGGLVGAMIRTNLQGHLPQRPSTHRTSLPLGEDFQASPVDQVVSEKESGSEGESEGTPWAEAQVDTVVPSTSSLIDAVTPADDTGSKRKRSTSQNSNGSDTTRRRYSQEDLTKSVSASQVQMMGYPTRSTNLGGYSEFHVSRLLPFPNTITTTSSLTPSFLTQQNSLSRSPTHPPWSAGFPMVDSAVQLSPGAASENEMLRRLLREARERIGELEEELRRERTGREGDRKT
ncbi:hypothetical protein BC829DRAFT_424119 [Chytridium lagenaria]|nr:hypothetical protein BC829DRAFT_424119 [Chytridium lagenaria]